MYSVPVLLGCIAGLCVIVGIYFTVLHCIRQRYDTPETPETRVTLLSSSDEPQSVTI